MPTVRANTVAWLHAKYDFWKIGEIVIQVEIFFVSFSDQDQDHDPTSPFMVPPLIST